MVLLVVLLSLLHVVGGGVVAGDVAYCVGVVVHFGGGAVAVAVAVTVIVMLLLYIERVCCMLQ